jgi:hypothetical protein
MGRHPRPLRRFCYSRVAEITDSLVDLLVGVVHKMDARADYRVEQELLADLKHVRGKRGILFALAQAAVDYPDDTVRRAIWPVVGEQTLHELVREAQANDQAFPGAGAQSAALLLRKPLPQDAPARASGAAVPL